MKKIKINTETSIFLVISLGFILWSSIFIRNSSFITIDGNRSFSLFDDAMISMRYAWNFSHGHGLVWNPGEYVQGYTNLLMTLLMSLSTLFFSKSIAVLTIQIIGIVFMLLVAYLTSNIADHIFPFDNQRLRSLIRVLSFICGLGYYPLVYWSLMGMETGLLTVLILAGIFTAFRYAQSGDNRTLLCSTIFFGLAFLTRNDSIIFVLLVSAYYAWESISQHADHNHLKKLFMAASIYALFVVGQLLFQYLYYGEILPNTYTLKLTGMPFSLRLQNGVGFVIPFLKETAIALVLAVVGVLFSFRKETLVLLLSVFSAIGYQVYIGGDPWNYWRMMSPVMPLVMILCINTFSLVAIRIAHSSIIELFFHAHPYSEKFIEVLVTLCTIAVLFKINFRFSPEALLQINPFETKYNARSVNTAIALNELLLSDASIGVFRAGTIPYYTDRTAIDFLGKSDRYIAQLPPDISGAVSWLGMQSVPGHNKYDLYYSIFSLQPTYIQDYSWGGQDLSSLAQTKYVKVKYRNSTFLLLKDSKSVLWSNISSFH